MLTKVRVTKSGKMGKKRVKISVYVFNFIRDKYTNIMHHPFHHCVPHLVRYYCVNCATHLTGHLLFSASLKEIYYYLSHIYDGQC